MKTKLLLVVASTLLLSAPAWCEESMGERVGKDIAIVAASGAGCAGGAVVAIGRDIHHASFKGIGTGCGVGAVVAGGGAIGLIESAHAEEAPSQADLQNTESDE